MLNSGKKISAQRNKKNNSNLCCPKKFLNLNPCKLNGRSLIFLSSNRRHNGFHYITLVLDDTFSDHDRIKVSGTTVKVND